MRAKLTSTTNKRFQYMEGVEGELRLPPMLDASAIFTEDNGHRLITSRVQQFYIEGSTVTLHTLNSVYVFEQVDI